MNFIKTERLDLAKEFGEGFAGYWIDVVQMSWLPTRITRELSEMNQRAYPTDSDATGLDTLQNEVLVKTLEILVKDWNLDNEGVKLPLPKEDATIVDELPMAFIQAIIQASGGADGEIPLETGSE